MMRMMADFMILPLGVGVSLSPYITACQEELETLGVKFSMHAYGTILEGEWDEVFGAIRRCHERLHEMGVPRISTMIKCGTRTDRTQTMEQKVESVEKRLASRDAKEQGEQGG